MIHAPRGLVVIIAAFAAGGSSLCIEHSPQRTAPPAISGYIASIEAWRAQREADLKAEDGWLSLVGLFWLQEGVNRVGGDPTADVPLPEGSAPGAVGTITFEDRIARFSPAAGAGVRVNGQPARDGILHPQPGNYDSVTTGTVTFFVIKRGERYGVRVRDSRSPARTTFAGLRWYPISEEYRVRAQFRPHPSPTSIPITNVLGATEPWPTPGTVVFTLKGREYTLHPVLDGPDARELFFIFKDRTTGLETYPGGRFLYSALPVNGEVVLDFNKAHSPPCAFTPFATCPVPPRENALPLPIEAGERDPHR
jgi:uncharacterized protein (DUF1684 family)